jgi:endonuclease YncB( thermonuclease family)
MHRIHALVLAAALVAAASHAEDRPPAPPLKDFANKPACAVVEVRAGDVLVTRVPDEQRVIRLIGVEIPKRDGCEAQAREFLDRLLTGEFVYLEYESDWPQHDHEGRTWAYAYRVPDGLLLNLELVRQGYAHVSDSRRFGQQPLLRAYEQLARKAHKGFWAPHSNESPDATTDTRPAAATPPNRTASSDTPSTQPSSSEEPLVYVTTSGHRYHTKDCQFTRHGATALTVKEARARGCTPCSKCKPPE